MKKIVIAGAGPAGLTAACALAARPGIDVTVVEASDTVGGLSRTVAHNGRRIDIGGHRLFSKNGRVNRLWQELMPEQPDDPQALDINRHMLRRPRASHIYFNYRLINYPIAPGLDIIRALGLGGTLRSMAGYMAAKISPRRGDTLEDFYINQFGRPLYRQFFEDYTQKVWGLHPSQMSALWGAQRVRSLSLAAVVRDLFRSKSQPAETSLIDSFLYPPLGVGQFWQLMARRAVEHGVTLLTSHSVNRIHCNTDRCIKSVEITAADGQQSMLPCDALLSSMPICDLVPAIDGCDVPELVSQIASGLEYRAFMIVGLLVDRTACSAIKDDNWIYIQSPEVKLGRVQVFDNWSPYMSDRPDCLWLGLEYFCNDGDPIWCKHDTELTALALDELIKTGLAGSMAAVHDAVVVRAPKAYPAYNGSYAQFDRLRQWLDSVPGLYCIGRNGQHRYNNMDHSMLSGLMAADAVISGTDDRSMLWAVNTEAEYHEQQ